MSLQEKLIILPNRIKELREKKELTQKELAKLMDLDVTTVNKHENMLRGVTEANVRGYCSIFKIETFELFHSVEQVSETAEEK